jgi:hypothetical protein
MRWGYGRVFAVLAVPVPYLKYGSTAEHEKREFELNKQPKLAGYGWSQDSRETPLGGY